MLQATLSAAISTAAQDSLNKTPLPAGVIAELKNVLPVVLAKANDLMGSIPTLAGDFNTTINNYFGGSRRDAVANQLSGLVAMLASKLSDVNMVQVCASRLSCRSLFGSIRNTPPGLQASFDQLSIAAALTQAGAGSELSVSFTFGTEKRTEYQNFAAAPYVPPELPLRCCVVTPRNLCAGLAWGRRYKLYSAASPCSSCLTPATTPQPA